MEETELRNLPEKIIFNNRSNNEIKALNHSFQNLKERLNESIKREVKSYALQLQASFDSLQAQVNPHFIYNILNFISTKGALNSDNEICEICDEIAAMLRYSTSTYMRKATIKEEIGHVNNYLSIMKKRYLHKLEYKIDVEDTVSEQEIPKIVVQQIVENSINHGFKGEVLTIKIKSYINDDFWYIDIIDNGNGISLVKLEDLQKKMKDMANDIANFKTSHEFSIGGMGLLNTYARLMLFYNNKFVFRIINLENGGVKVTIGSTYQIFL